MFKINDEVIFCGVNCVVVEVGDGSYRLMDSGGFYYYTGNEHIRLRNQCLEEMRLACTK